MDVAIQPGPHRATESLRVLSNASALTVAAIYHLSESGRKASLLTGGDGKAVQRLSIQVPATRAHLVVVDVNGIARLKLRPRFDRVDGVVVRHDGPPSYDFPPALEDLFKEAAKNHELEREFRSERSQSRDRRRDTDRERRVKIAEEFFGSPSQRAMAHPAPTPTRCFMATADGRVMFDAKTDIGPARDIPREAYRRFRADVRARKEHNLTLRAQQLAVHEEKTRVIAEWVARNGSEDQRGRHAAGLLPVEEVIDALTEEAFATVVDVPRYPLDGAARLQAHLRDVAGRSDITVAPADLQIVGVDATAATTTQWAVMQQLRAQLPGAHVTLREHRLSSRRDPMIPGLSVYGVLVTRHIGPFVLRREFSVPER